MKKWKAAMVGGCHSINQCTACVVRAYSIMPVSPILPNIDFSLFSQIFCFYFGQQYNAQYLD